MMGLAWLLGRHSSQVPAHPSAVPRLVKDEAEQWHRRVSSPACKGNQQIRMISSAIGTQCMARYLPAQRVTGMLSSHGMWPRGAQAGNSSKQRACACAASPTCTAAAGMPADCAGSCVAVNAGWLFAAVAAPRALPCAAAAAGAGGAGRPCAAPPPWAASSPSARPPPAAAAPLALVPAASADPNADRLPSTDRLRGEPASGSVETTTELGGLLYAVLGPPKDTSVMALERPCGSSSPAGTGCSWGCWVAAAGE